MSEQREHSKILTAEGRRALRPLGLEQKGRSRVWLYDGGWWIGVVDFQSSAWSRGSYLNVGVVWPWAPFAASFQTVDWGGRVSVPFIEFENHNQFRPLAASLADVAAEEIESFKTACSTPASAAHHLATWHASESRRLEMYRQLRADLDEGILWGLSGDSGKAHALFACYLDKSEPHRDSAKIVELRSLTGELDALLDHRAAFTERIREEIEAGRALLKLDPAAEMSV